MKIAFVIPINHEIGEKSFYDYQFIANFILSKKYFSYLLAIPILISLTPDEHEVRVFDENIENVDYNWGADLVGISVHTKFAHRAYQIADKFRQKGVKTVLGGIHPSVCANEALEHCDAVVIGEAEYIWAKLLSDAQSNRLEKIYQADRKFDLDQSNVPRRSGVAMEKYLADIVQTTRGCPFNCEFCSVYSFNGQTIRNKPIEKVIKEIEDISIGNHSYKKKSIFFADDNIIANKKYARRLFESLKPYKLNWSCQASINIAKEDELLKLMKEAGCGAILIGFETLSQKNLERMGKKVNQRNDYIKAIKKIQSYGILVHSSFILGCDFDTAQTFDQLIDFIEETHLLMPLINILTPFPGTRLYERLQKEGRILHTDWRKYDSKHVVFKPMQMSPEELMDGYRKVIKSVYSFNAIYKKLSYYWQKDFWMHSNMIDPIKFKYRFIFALRLGTLLYSQNWSRSKFILKILPKVFQKQVRISNILVLMAYNDYAYS